MNEIWKDIIGYEKIYQVSDKGRVRSLDKKVKQRFGFRIKRGKLLKLSPDCAYGYILVGLCNESKPITHRVHRLVAFAFIPNPENKPQINHKNGVKTDNRVENLEWATHSENQLHKYRVLGCVGKGGMRGAKGVLHPRSTPIVKIDLNGNVVQRYENAKIAADEHNFSNSNLYQVLKDRYGRKSLGGFKWKYEHELLTNTLNKLP